MRRSLVVLALLSACHRPVDGRGPGSSSVADVEVSPAHVRAGVPIQISFSVAGVPPKSVSYRIAGQPYPCTPERTTDARYHCTHPGVERTAPQGTGLVVVEVTDEVGRTTSANGQVTIDFDCPQITSLGVSPQVAQPGDHAIVAIEVSEDLASPPVVTRFGRTWEPPAGSGRSYTVTHAVTIADPPAQQDIVVRAVDRAGNSSTDCGIDGRTAFAVDQSQPIVDVTKIRIDRALAGMPSVITASAGAFLDDVGVDHVVIADATGLEVAEVRPEPDGSFRPTSLGLRTTSRVELIAVDRFGRKSLPVSVRERWRVSLGTGSTPKSAIRTGVRATPAPPNSDALATRTVELAPDLLEVDGRSASIRARIGFEPAGRLPSALDDVYGIVAGYDVRGDSIILFGGARDDPQVSLRALDRTWILRFDPDRGEYVADRGPTAPAPPKRAFGRIAFDGDGCGLIFGGDSEFGARNDVWQICGSAGGRYSWREIMPENAMEAFPLYRSRSPIIYDPEQRRYVVVQGRSNAGPLFPTGDVLFLVRDPVWRWETVTQLPTNFGERYGHLLYWEPRIGGFIVALGYVTNPNASPRYDEIDQLLWAYRRGQWSASSVPEGEPGQPGDLVYRQAFGYDYDTARHILVLYGGSSGGRRADPLVWQATRTATIGPSAWRASELADTPTPRFTPTLVYDQKREVTLMFGGVAPLSDAGVPERSIAGELWRMHLAPSWPELQATIDLGAARPEGIERLVVTARAEGSGDGEESGGGVEMRLWDHASARWVLVARTPSAITGPVTITADLRDAPARFIAPDGTIPLSLRTRYPATEAVDARLEVDLVDGHLELGAGR